MDEVRQAIDGSIAKWQAIVDGTGSDQGVWNCPLCGLFYEYKCFGCPISTFAQASSCDNTPYRKRWAKLFTVFEQGTQMYADTPERLKAAKAELAFLEELKRWWELHK
jgi:hypothetical protein